MIASFFQSLERHDVRYLLISGQATVLYGAATFSEDIDLWIEPSDPNRTAFLAVLHTIGARYHKLTPPFLTRNLERGHGFHFVLPGTPPVFLDVMGCPPRAPRFVSARADARAFDTAWGTIPTVAAKDLVEIKKTQRPGDYPVIGRLVLARLAALPEPSPTDFRWALDNVFGIDEFSDLIRRWPAAAAFCRPGSPQATVAAQSASGAPAEPEDEEELARLLTERAYRCQRADRAYWRDIIEELRELRRQGGLMPVGAYVEPAGTA